MDPVKLAMARGVTLKLLLSQLNLEQETGEDSLGRYLLDGILHQWLARRGFPMSLGELRGNILTYLKDKGLVKYRQVQAGGPGTEVDIFWRIDSGGMEILEGRKSDPGVKVL